MGTPPRRDRTTIVLCLGVGLVAALSALRGHHWRWLLAPVAAGALAGNVLLLRGAMRRAPVATATQGQSSRRSLRSLLPFLFVPSVVQLVRDGRWELLLVPAAIILLTIAFAWMASPADARRRA